MNAFLRRIGIEHPIILAPMGGGPGTPELIAAVANAGGLGSFAGGYLTPDNIREDYARIRALTSRPININLFAGGYHEGDVPDGAPMLAIMRRVHEQLGIAPPALPPLQRNPFPEQLEIVLELKPKVFSFTFGNPDTRRVREAGIIVIGTATTVEEARALAPHCDAVVAQGAEAGAHRGTFAKPFEQSMVPTLDLVEQIARDVKMPVIASGGLMDGRDIKAALDRGAVAVQLGTAFLACPESGAAASYKDAVLNAKSDTTVVTRAFSGRHARGLRNEFIDIVPEDAVLPFPVQNALTRPMRSKGDARYLSLWAGTGVSRARAMPAADLVATLLEEMRD
jgi:nitronate monooxygenase